MLAFSLVSGDDETREDKPADAPDDDEAVERARDAAAKAYAPKKRDPGRWLALIPITIGVLMMALMMPRATVPDAVPLPTVDAHVLSEVMRADDARAEKAKAT